MAVNLPSTTNILDSDLISDGNDVINNNFSSINQASTDTQAGLLQFGTSGEIIAGTDNEKGLSIEGLATKLSNTNNVLPLTHNTYNIGSNAKQYANGFFTNTTIASSIELDGASLTISGGTLVIDGSPLDTGIGPHNIEDNTIHNVNGTPTNLDIMYYNIGTSEWNFIKAPFLSPTISPVAGEALVYVSGNTYDTQGIATSLSGLSDVSITSPQFIGEGIFFNGTNYVNASTNINIPKLSYIKANPLSGITPINGTTTTSFGPYDQDVINESTEYQGDIESCQGLIIDWSVRGTGASSIVSLSATFKETADEMNFAYVEGQQEIRGTSIIPWTIEDQTVEFYSSVTNGGEFDIRVVGVIYTNQGSVAPGFSYTFMGGRLNDSDDFASPSSTDGILPYDYNDFLNGATTPITGWGSVLPTAVSQKVTRSKICYKGFNASEIESEIVINVDWLSLSAYGFYNFYNQNRWGHIVDFDNNTGTFTIDAKVGTAPSFEMELTIDQFRKQIFKLPKDRNSLYHNWHIDHYTIDNLVGRLNRVFPQTTGTVSLNANNFVSFVNTDVDLPAINSSTFEATLKIKNESGGSITITASDPFTSLNGTSSLNAGETIEYASLFDNVALTGEWRELSLHT